MGRCSSLAALPSRAEFLRFFLIECPIQAAVNDQGSRIMPVQYFHLAVQEETLFFGKLYNVIKVLVPRHSAA
jgi:hypothetical protein